MYFLVFGSTDCGEIGFGLFDAKRRKRQKFCPLFQKWWGLGQSPKATMLTLQKP
jgi:hypothetical protein